MLIAKYFGILTFVLSAFSKNSSLYIKIAKRIIKVKKKCNKNIEVIGSTKSRMDIG